MNRIASSALVWMLAAGLGALACGRPSSLTSSRTPAPTASPVPARSGIASGAAVGPNAAGIAPPAPPASVVPAPGDRAAAVDDACPATHPIKVARDTLAYAPDSAGYAAVQAIECYTTLAAAAANGDQPAGDHPGALQTIPSATPAPSGP
jgi:hypothetical protein